VFDGLSQADVVEFAGRRTVRLRDGLIERNQVHFDHSEPLAELGGGPG
jgi:hypothetical protein